MIKKTMSMALREIKTRKGAKCLFAMMTYACE